jgi:hypothetical protein
MASSKFFFFFDLLTFYQRRSKVNDTKTLKVVYQANQKEKLLGKLGSLIVSLKISYKNSSTFRCNLGFVNKFCKLKSTPWVLHAFCNFLCASDKFEQRKIMCFTVSFSLPQNLHAGSHTYCIQNVGFWSTSSYCNWMIPWRAIFFDFLNVDIAKYYFKKLELSFKTWTNSGCKSYIRCIHP